MKKLSLFMIVLALSGCALQGRYDNNEYAALATLHVFAQAANESCAVQNRLGQVMGQLQFQAEYFYVYTKYRSANSDTLEMAQTIVDNINEMELRYQTSVPSPAYCIEKTQFLINIIHAELENFQERQK